MLTKKNGNMESEIETKVPSLEVRETFSAFQKICVHKIKLFNSFEKTFSLTINETLDLNASLSVWCMEKMFMGSTHALCPMGANEARW